MSRELTSRAVAQAEHRTAAQPLTIKQAAARYGVGEKQLREAIHRKELRYIPWGAHMRLLPETLDAYFRGLEQFAE